MDASHAFKSDNFAHYAVHFTRLRDRGAWAARAWLFEHFGYDLRVPTNLDKCGALRRSDRAARASATTVEAFFSASISSLTPAEEDMFVVSQ